MCASFDFTTANGCAAALRTYRNAYDSPSNSGWKDDYKEIMQKIIKQSQRNGFLMDYDPVTCEKKITGKPGVDAVKRAIREIEVVPGAPTKEPAKAHG